MQGDAVDATSIPGSERSSGEGNVSLLQYSILGNLMERGAWWATAHEVTKSCMPLSNLAQALYQML